MKYRRLYFRVKSPSILSLISISTPFCCSLITNTILYFFGCYNYGINLWNKETTTKKCRKKVREGFKGYNNLRNSLNRMKRTLFNRLLGFSSFYRRLCPGCVMLVSILTWFRPYISWRLTLPLLDVLPLPRGLLVVLCGTYLKQSKIAHFFVRIFLVFNWAKPLLYLAVLCSTRIF